MWSLCILICYSKLYYYFCQGNVYVKCPTIPAAMAAVSALHGRWFGGNSKFCLNSSFTYESTVTICIV